MDIIEICNENNIVDGLYILSVTLKSKNISPIVIKPLYQWIERINGFKKVHGFLDPLKIYLLDQNLKEYNGCVIDSKQSVTLKTPIYLLNCKKDIFLCLEYQFSLFLLESGIEIVESRISYLNSPEFYFIINKLSLEDEDFLFLPKKEVDKIITCCLPNENLNYISNTLSNTFPITSYVLSTTYNYFTYPTIYPDNDIKMILSKILTENNFNIEGVNVIKQDIDLYKSHNFLKKLYGDINLKNYNLYTVIIFKS